ncbi:hypothetical protein Tco_0131335 [Tanacetum coccineum]
MFDARHQNGYASVAWLIKRWMKRKGAVLRSLSALIYCKDLDTTTLRELIDSEGRFILEDPQPSGAYNPPGYAQPQYDQYYQQYPLPL